MSSSGSVIVAQVLPWSQEQLRLDDGTRWAKLVPLVRPSVSVSEVGEVKVLVDAVEVSKKNQVQVVVVSDAVHVAEAFLSGGLVAACVVDPAGKIEAGDVVRLVGERGVNIAGSGVMVVRTGTERRLETLDVGAGESAVEVVLESEAARSHVVSLLTAVDEKERQSLRSVVELLQQFIRSAKSTTTVFYAGKIGEKIVIVHSGQREEFETAKQVIEKDLTNLLREQANDIHQGLPVTYSVNCVDINGLSKLESWLLSYEVSRFLDAQSIPHRLTTSTVIDPSLDSRGYILSILPVLQTVLKPVDKPSNPLSNPSVNSPELTSSLATPPPSKSLFADADVRSRLVSGCESLISAEPRITEYDTIVGDGDCGLTLRDGARKVISFIQDKDLSNLPVVLGQLVDELEVTMGGTSGALYCIFLSSLSQTLGSIAAPSEFPSALYASLNHLLRFTSARLGDRTMLDALIPFAETLKTTRGDVSNALAEARKGVESTKKLEAKLGRSTYLDEKATRGVPDPGAVGVLVLLEGLSDAAVKK